ncbi:MAG: HAMP domain-containing histidine kinase [Betaproteobacteria bacterium]|nr:HAMP domain-containing histidine kinase [Betaproteobacteria bacterium]
MNSRSVESSLEGRLGCSEVLATRLDFGATMSVWAALCGAFAIIILLLFDGLSRISSDLIFGIRLSMLGVLATILLLFAFRRKWVIDHYSPVVALGCAVFLAGILAQIYVPGVLSPESGFDVMPVGMLAVFMIYTFLRLPVIIIIPMGLIFSAILLIALGRVTSEAGLYRSIFYLGVCNLIGLILCYELRRYEKRVGVERARALQAELEARTRADECLSLLETRMALVAGINHDLSQPVVALDASVMMAISTLERGDLSGVRNALLTAKNSLIYFRDSLSHLLLVARGVDADTVVRVSEVDVCELLRTLVSQFDARSGSEESQIKCRFSSPKIFVLSNAGYLNQVVANIVGNAVKFSKFGVSGKGSVIIRVREHHQICTVDIIDNGPGIPDGDRDRIWGLYERGAQQSFAPGSGLGLALVKFAIAQLPDHAITMKSWLGRGSRFRISMPVAPAIGQIDLLAVEPSCGTGAVRSSVMVVVQDGLALGGGISQLLSALGLDVVIVNINEARCDISKLIASSESDLRVVGVVYCADILRLGTWLLDMRSMPLFDAQSSSVLVIPIPSSEGCQQEIVEKFPDTKIRWMHPGFGPMDLLNALEGK